MSQRKLEHSITPPFVNSTASSNDMTGLVPSGIQNEYEESNYEDVYPYLAPIPQPPGVQTPDPAVWEDSVHTGTVSKHSSKITNENRLP